MHFDILPSVDQRIANWLETQKKVAEPDPTAKYRFSITLSRAFGCEGYPLAVALKERLEQLDVGHRWTIFDRSLIDKILQDNNVSRKLLENFGRKNVFYDSLMSNIDPHWTSDADVYELMVKTIMSLAEEGRAIFVGRGASVVTAELKRCFHFRLDASEEYRINSLMDRSKQGRDAVLAMMEEKEKERENFINRFLGCDMNDISNFHLVFNNEKNSVEQMAETITSHVDLHMKTLLK
ncbi:MAG: cytidylate kinase-like family protein [bacterium]|nr:cytidylate kinase-like family protein [bacterium]